MNKNIEPLLKLHNISKQSYELLCELAGVSELTPLDRPWICDSCGFIRIFEESKKAHIEWHERRRQ